MNTHVFVLYYMHYLPTYFATLHVSCTSALHYTDVHAHSKTLGAVQEIHSKEKLPPRFKDVKGSI